MKSTLQPHLLDSNTIERFIYDLALVRAYEVAEFGDENVDAIDEQWARDAIADDPDAFEGCDYPIDEALLAAVEKESDRHVDRIRRIFAREGC